MSDIFSLKSVPLNAELGMALKNFRIENKVTARSIVEQLGKASSYISKLEKGDIKKIDGELFTTICNLISGSDDGLKKFMEKTVSLYNSYSEETRLILTNIDDLLIEHPVPSKLIKDINDYILKHNISIEALSNKINTNVTISDHSEYNSAPLNQWTTYGNDTSNTEDMYIKLYIPVDYLNSLISGNVFFIHSIIAEAILTCMYSFGMDDLNEARRCAHSKLTLYNILRSCSRNIIEVTDSNFDDLFGGLEPGVADTLASITSGLKLISTLTKKDGYGLSKLKQIQQNLSTDIGFYFAYMSLNITALEQKSKTTKQDFLDELKTLIQKYSSDLDGIDLYN